MFNFSIYGKVFKSFTLIQVRYCILDICYIRLIVIPDFPDIYLRDQCMKSILSKVMVTFIKDWNINSIIWNCVLVSTMYYIELFMTWVGLLIIWLYPVDIWESISLPVESVISFLYVEHQALKSLVTSECKGNSWLVFFRNKSHFGQKSNSQWLWLGQR